MAIDGKAAHYEPIDAAHPRPSMRTIAYRRFLFGIACLLSAIALAPAAGAQSAYTQGLLWKIEGRAREPSYVYGTIHISDPRVTALPEPVRRSFDASRALAIEVTLDPASFKPWAVALFLMMPDADPANVLDFTLQRMATEQRKSVSALETVDEQVDVFDRLGEREQVALLRDAVENRERLPALIQRLVGAYLARDLAALNRISEESHGDAETRRVTDALMHRLLYERNVRLAQRADALFGAGGAFVAVGALHLYGERGVLAELARHGYRVSRVY